jgi:hypothetical protein
LPNLVVGLVLFAEKERKSRDGSSSRRDMMIVFEEFVS